MSNIDWENLDKSKTEEIDWDNLNQSTVMARDGEQGYGTAIKTGLLGALGNAVGTFQRTLNAHAKPSYMSDEEWEAQKPSIHKFVEDKAQELENNNRVQFDPWSGKSIAQGVAGIVPYATVLAPAAAMSMRSGNANALRTAGNYLGSKAGLGSKGIEIAGEALPALAIGAMGSYPEAAMEGQSAYEDAIKEGKSPEDASDIQKRVTALNVALLTGTNAAELLTMFGGLKSILPKNTIARLGTKLGSMFVTEGAEEGAQEIIPQKAAGEDVDWDRVGQATVIGGIGGIVLGGMGMGANHMLDKYANKRAEAIKQTVNDSNVDTSNTSPASSSDLVNRVRSLEGKIPYVAEDGTNCMRTLGIALDGTPFAGQINVDQAIATAQENGLLKDPSNYTPQPGDIAVVNDGNHVVMVTENGGTIQNGASKNGVYESEQSPQDMFGSVKYYIQTSAYNKNSGTNTSFDPQYMTEFLANNQYTYDAETNNAIADALETQDNGKITDLFKKLHTTEESSQAQENVSADIKNTATGETVQSDADNNDVRFVPASLSQLISRVKSGQGSKPSFIKQNNIVVGRSSELENRLRKSGAVDMIQRAFKGDTSAMQAFKKLRPEVQETLKRITGIEPKLNGAREFSPKDVGMHLVRNGIVNKQALAAKDVSSKPVERGFIPPEYYTDRQKFLESSAAMDEQRRARESVIDAGERLLAEQRLAEQESLDKSRAAEWDRMEKEAREGNLSFGTQEDGATKSAVKEDRNQLIGAASKINPKNPVSGWKHLMKITQDGIDSMINPLVEKMKADGKKGVAIVQGENGRGTRSSNNPRWYQSLYAKLGRTPTDADYKRYAYDVLTNADSAQEFHEFSHDGNQEFMNELENNKAVLDGLNEYKQSLEDVKADIESMAKKPVKQIKKATNNKVNGLSQDEIKDLVSDLETTDVDKLMERDDSLDNLDGKSNQELFDISFETLDSRIGEKYRDPLGNQLYFEPGRTENLNTYTMHLISGQGKGIDDIRIQRVAGVIVADKTIKKPWAIVRQNNGRKMYLSMYKSKKDFTNSLIIGVEEGQDGRVVTSIVTTARKGDKKAALREFKKCVSGADEVLYIWEGLSGYSRPSSEQQASTLNTKLHPSGDLNVSQNAKNVNKNKENVSLISEKTNRFDKNRAESSLDALIGRKQKEERIDKKFVDIVDESELDAELSKIKSKFDNLSANPMFDPALMKSLTKVGMIYLQKGVNRFGAWSEKMVGAAGEKVRPFLKSIWGTLNAYPNDVKFNDDIMTAVMEYVGSGVDAGKSLQQIKSEFANAYGDEYIGYVDAAHKGIADYPFTESENMVESDKESKDKEGDDNVHGSTARLVERDSTGADQNKVGADNGAAQSDRVDGRDISTPRERSGAQGGSRVHGSSATAGRKRSDNVVRDGKELGDTVGSARGAGREGGGNVSKHGAEQLHDGRTDQNVGASTVDGRDNDATKESKVGSVQERSRTDFDSEKIAKVKKEMPHLLDGQVQDVVFAEKRLFESNQTGVLFANGTGTGKTFSGLAIVARQVAQGKNNVLIVTPSQQVNTAWLDADKGHFKLGISQLESTKDAGSGPVITTLANFGDNKALIHRDWDMIMIDESQNLLNNEKGENTLALRMLRALTLHKDGARDRFMKLYETDAVRSMQKEMSKLGNTPSDKERANELAAKIWDHYAALQDKRKEIEEQANSTDISSKPKTVFLSATPFAYVKNIDYAHGYLFDYPAESSGGYNAAGGRERFLMEHFGYRMRYNKLTMPDNRVDNRINEVNFHEWLKKEGALSSRVLDIDQDYDRGFIVVDGGVGSKIDEGFEWLSQKKNGEFRELREILSKQFDGRTRNYVLEALKARGAINIIKDYIQAGKKVVLFHDSKKARTAFHPFKLDGKLSIRGQSVEETAGLIARAKEQYERFCAARPDLVGLNLNDLKSPIETLQDAFGEDILLFNGDVPQHIRNKNVDDFNSDDSGKNIILVQSQAGNSGISMHDTTGKHPRVLINLGIPRRPIFAIQIEGRIYRVGNKSNAIFRYLSTGTNMEKHLFASTIAERASTAENLAMGNGARNLRGSFIDAFTATLDGSWVDNLPGGEYEGIGGKEKDRSTAGAITEYDYAKSLYYGQQKKTSRNKAAEGKDYFATPEPVGFKMVEWAGLKDGERVLEPSAGHGAISRFFSPNQDITIIEPSAALAPLAQLATDNGKLIQSAFEDHNVINKYDAIVMNPPFGTGGKTAMEHVAKAFQHLKLDGRVIAIVPDGPSMGKRFDGWLESDASKGANVVARVKLPACTFEKAGTRVSCEILVIDKVNPKAQESLSTQRDIDLSKVDSIDELFNRLENISMPERAAKDVTQVQTADKNAESARVRNRTAVGIELGEHKNTKTGDVQYKAKMDKKVSQDVYTAMNGIARKHQGYYSRFARGFLFGSEENAQSFKSEGERYLDEVDAKSYSIRDINSGKELTEKDILKLAKEAVPNAKGYDVDMHTVSVEMPNGSRLTINLVDEILATPEQLAKASRDHGVSVTDSRQLQGSMHMIGIDGVIELARDSEDGTIDHEVMEFAKKVALTPRENGALDAAIPGTEKQCDAYRDWKRLKKQGKGSNFGKLWQKIKDFAERIKALFGNVEAKRKLAVEDVFEKVASGEVWNRDVDSKLSSDVGKYSINVNMDYSATYQPLDLSSMSDKIGDVSDTDTGRAAVISYIKKQLTGTNTSVSSADMRLKYSFDYVDKGNRVHVASARSGKGKNLESRVARNLTLSNFDDVLKNSILVEIDENPLKKNGPYANKEHQKHVAAVMRAVVPVIMSNGQLRTLVITADNRSGQLHKDDIAVSLYEVSTRKIKNTTGPFFGHNNGASQQNQSVGLSLAEILWNVKDLRGGYYVDHNTGQLNIEQDASKRFSVVSDDISYSIRTATDNLVNNLKGKSDERIEVREKKVNPDENFGFIDSYLRSPGWLAERYPKLKLFFKMADKAMQRQEELRSEFDRKLNKINSHMKTDAERADWQRIMLEGDAMGKEFTVSELKEQGVSDNVIKSYIQSREAIRKAYNLLNDARKQVRTHQKNMSGSALEALRKDKFATILKADRTDEDNYIVVYKSPKVWNKTVTMDGDNLKELRTFDNVQIGKVVDNKNGSFTVSYRETVGDIHNRTGYIPHFFHDFFVMTKSDSGKVDENGEAVYDYVVVGSGRTIKDAYRKAEKYLEDNPDSNIVIQPKQFSFDADEGARAAIVGDVEYQNMVKKIAKDMEMSIGEAKEFMQGKVKTSNKHRFFGNFMQRKGAKGFEENMNWLLKHYFNATGRYVALEEFKPDAKGLFERYFGRFDNDYADKPLAYYVKQYINDMNGNPSNVEMMINNFLNRSDWYRKHIASNFGDRAALQLASSITGKISILKLGFLNVSSALLNLSQLINTVGLIGKFAPVAGGMKNAINPSISYQKIYKETGILNDIAMDTTSGYGKFKPGNVAAKSMYLFRKMDMYARKATVLAAYHSGIQDGMNHAQAIAYAKEINRKANFDYGVADAPNVFRRGSVFSQVALQFKKYPIKELELMYELATKGTAKQNAKFWGTYFLVCGLLQFPAADWFDDIWQDLFGDSPKRKIQKMIMEAAGDDPMGKELAKIAMYGIMSASPMNVDMSRRAGVGDVTLSVDNGLTGLLGGATVSTAKQTVQGLPALFHGDTLPVIRALSPTLGNYMQAVLGHTEGKRGRTNSRLDSTYDAILKAAGFRNVDESITSDMQQIIGSERSQRTKERQAAMDKVLAKQTRKEKLSNDDVAELRRLGITGKQLDAERQKKRMDAQGRIKSGLSTKEAAQYRDLLKFMK